MECYLAVAIEILSGIRASVALCPERTCDDPSNGVPLGTSNGQSLIAAAAGALLLATPRFQEESMVSWHALLLPSVISAVLVFIASSLIHMVVKWHKSDYKTLPNEDEVRMAIRKSSPVPGKYVMPFCKDGKEMASPEMQKK